MDIDKDTIYTLIAITISFLVFLKLGQWVSTNWKFSDLRYKENQQKKKTNPEYNWYMYQQ